MTLYGQSAAVAGFVAALIPGCDRGFGECQAIGFLDAQGGLEAGAVYHNWNPEGGVIEISSASTHRAWLTRPRLRQMFAYPFTELGCQLVVARIAEGNTRARRIWRVLGADEFVIPRLRSRSEAECIFTLTPERWASSKFEMSKR